MSERWGTCRFCEGYGCGMCNHEGYNGETIEDCYSSTRTVIQREREVSTEISLQVIKAFLEGLNRKTKKREE